MLEGKTALITGGAKGLGKAIALKMAGSGADIAIVDYCGPEMTDATCLECAAFGVTARGYRCDVSDFEQTRRLVNEIIADFGGIDILVNNAGITADKLILQMSEADFDRVLNINLKGAFNMIRHTYQHFMRKRGGRIINMASVAGLMGNAGQANYSASKAGLIGLTKTTAKELGSRGVTCNAIAPGFIDTDMTAVLSEAVKEEAVKLIPMRHMGTPEDVANAALFLASDMSGYITGEVIRVDGGMCM